MAEFVDPTADFDVTPASIPVPAPSEQPPQAADPATLVQNLVIVNPPALPQPAADDPVAQLQAQIAAAQRQQVVQEVFEDDLEHEGDYFAAAPRATNSDEQHIPTVPAVGRALPAPGLDRPIPEDQLTEEQRQIRRLEDQLARTQARNLDSDKALVFDEVPTTGQLIEFYVVRDGFGAWGETWYRGQEFAVVVGSEQYNDTFDRLGNSWLALLDNEWGQEQRWGEVKIRRGRWPGQPWQHPVARQREQARNRAAPILRV